jgi:predicted DNA-binding transcriptional regulator AlpA
MRRDSVLDSIGSQGDCETPHSSPVQTERFTLRLDEVAKSLGVSRRAIERERSAGRFPSPDCHIGKCPLWSPQTIRRWVEGGGKA